MKGLAERTSCLPTGQNLGRRVIYTWYLPRIFLPDKIGSRQPYRRAFHPSTASSDTLLLLTDVQTPPQ